MCDAIICICACINTYYLVVYIHTYSCTVVRYGTYVPIVPIYIYIKIHVDYVITCKNTYA